MPPTAKDLVICHSHVHETSGRSNRRLNGQKSIESPLHEGKVTEWSPFPTWRSQRGCLHHSSATTKGMRVFWVISWRGVKGWINLGRWYGWLLLYQRTLSDRRMMLTGISLSSYHLFAATTIAYASWRWSLSWKRWKEGFMLPSEAIYWDWRHWIMRGRAQDLGSQSVSVGCLF